MKIILSIVGTMLVMFIAGCSHNIHAHGWGIVTPYFSAGNGTVDIVKDNVKSVISEKTTADGVETTATFKVGDQTTGYDVDLNKK
jgi:hypothetical protein